MLLWADSAYTHQVNKDKLKKLKRYKQVVLVYSSLVRNYEHKIELESYEAFNAPLYPILFVDRKEAQTEYRNLD